MTIHKLILDDDNEYNSHIEVIEEGEWEISFKDYAFKQDIVKCNTKFYAVTHNRSGNYYSDYDYGDVEIVEVKPVQVTVTQYQPL